MPPRFVYWTIIAGGLPTAFRAAERDDLLPTFKRILQKHPDAEMKWFARGRLWASPDEVREYTARPKSLERRDRNWRPGGEHRDPREERREAARARNQSHRRERFLRKERAAAKNTPADRPPRSAEQGEAKRPPRRPPHRQPRPSSQRNGKRRS
jgi:hypothetical protein